MRVRVELVPQYLWIGVHWNDSWPTFDVWICIIPMLPIHLQFGPDYFDDW